MTRRTTVLSRSTCCFALVLPVGAAIPQPEGIGVGNQPPGQDDASATSTGVERNGPDLPRNLFATPRLGPVLNDLWRRSGTFRAQCQRIGSSPLLSVALRLVPTRIEGLYPALSEVARHADGTVDVTIRIAWTVEYAELVAHELEHAIEAAEGVDLDALAAAKDGSAFRNSRGYFETRRAAAVGQTVARECLWYPHASPS
jgi:hypothetical protein